MFELAMVVLTVLCLAGVLLIVVLHLGFRGECLTLRIC